MSEARSLAKLGVAWFATVRALEVDFPVRERLAALGLKPGRRVQVMRRRGTGGPIQVRIGHTDLVLRAADAERIAVEVEVDA